MSLSLPSPSLTYPSNPETSPAWVGTARSAESIAPLTAQASALPSCIDMNQLPPSGSIESLEKLIQSIGSNLGMDVIAGVLTSREILQASTSNLSHQDNAQESAIENGLREAASATKSCFFATQENQSSLTLQSVRQALNARCVLGFGLSHTPMPCGFILILDESSANKSGEELTKVVEHLRGEVTVWLSIWYHCYIGRGISQRWRRFEQLLNFRKHWKVGILGLLACLFIPVPYWPQRDCLVEPAFRRFLTSPTEGRVIDASVRPGDVVQVDQLLARIDDDQIRWELAKAEAEYQQAQKKRDSALAARAGGEARLAELEKERISAQIRSLQSQLSQLEIRSPIEGIVIAGDWVPTAGATVRRADTLFEIAPLEKMRVQTLLSSEDLGLISVGTPITLRVDAAHGHQWQETIQRIDPRGRPENSQVVFYAEAEVDNQAQLLRPGMRGSVRLAPGMKSLGWILFHRPYIWLMKKLAW